jgi:hypothetical protein
MESKHFVTASASTFESPSRERPGCTGKPCDMSWALMYWIVDVEEGIDDVDDADEGESDNGEGIGEGAQWTVFLDAGVAAMAMRVDDVRVS